MDGDFRLEPKPSVGKARRGIDWPSASGVASSEAYRPYQSESTQSRFSWADQAFLGDLMLLDLPSLNEPTHKGWAC